MLSKLNRRALAGTKAEIQAEAVRVDAEWAAEVAELEAKLKAVNGVELSDLQDEIKDLKHELEQEEDRASGLARELDDKEGELWEAKQDRPHHERCNAYGEDRPGMLTCTCDQLLNRS